MKNKNKNKYGGDDMPLTKKTPIEQWIKDFVDSDDPRFAGKSRDERIKMAKGAYYAKLRESQMSLSEWILYEESAYALGMKANGVSRKAWNQSDRAKRIGSRDEHRKAAKLFREAIAAHETASKHPDFVKYNYDTVMQNHRDALHFHTTREQGN